jgi:hypothetical protein
MLDGFVAPEEICPATAGCNTIEGAGKDIQAAGSAMSGTAKDTEEEMTQ